MKNLRHVYVCTLEVSAPGGSGNLGVHQILTGLCEPGSKFDAMSFQQNFLECNCSTLFSFLFMRSRELKDEINLKVSNRRGVPTLSSCQWIPSKPLIAAIVLVRRPPFTDSDALRSAYDAFYSSQDLWDTWPVLS